MLKKQLCYYRQNEEKIESIINLFIFTDPSQMQANAKHSLEQRQ